MPIRHAAFTMQMGVFKFITACFCSNNLMAAPLRHLIREPASIHSMIKRLRIIPHQAHARGQGHARLHRPRSSDSMRQEAATLAVLVCRLARTCIMLTPVFR